MLAHPQSTTAARNLNHSGSFSSIAEGPGLAHDAGNLLQALTLYCDLLGLPGVLRPEHLHYARELSLLSQRSGLLIHRLLLGEEDTLAPTACRSPPLQSAAAVVRAFGPLLRILAAPDATVSLIVAPNLPPLPFASEVLERLLVNLTRNAAVALRFHTSTDASGTPCAGRIRISVSGDETRLRLTVADNGPGMAPKIAASFLKPTPLPSGAVNGLGHRVIADLLQSTGGKLSIKVQPGRGTSLQIEWPIAPVTAVSFTSIGPSTRRTHRAGSTLSC
jgi:nitrogen-specific signal transduction histidine kinase